MDRKSIVDKAREYLGTPFRHQGRLKGVGVDCAGLIVCVAKELKLSDFDYTSYGRVPNSNELIAVLNEQLIKIKIDEVKSGDIYLMTFDFEPQHVGIATENGIIHSYSSAKQVVEHGIDTTWSSRIKGAYRFKGIK